MVSLPIILYCKTQVNPFPEDKFWTYKLTEFVDNNFKFDEIERKILKLVENFLLCPQCFQKTCIVDTCKPEFVWERVKIVQNKAIAVDTMNVDPESRVETCL